jgi:hypothetical protein
VVVAGGGGREVCGGDDAELAPWVIGGQSPVGGGGDGAREAVEVAVTSSSLCVLTRSNYKTLTLPFQKRLRTQPMSCIATTTT